MGFKQVSVGGVHLAAWYNRQQMNVGFWVKNPIWQRLAVALGGSEVPVLAPHLNGSDVELAIANPTPEAQALWERVRKIVWYHTLDLGHGVITPGYYDHNPYLDRYNMPKDLRGKRVLDVATYDGFWAYQFEKRGAEEVVGLDIDSVREVDLAPRIRNAMSEEDLNHPTGAGFQLAKEMLGSRVKRVTCNVYALSPEKMGMFDVVHVGDLLLHLCNPIMALQNMYSVTNEYALISDCYFPELDGLGFDRAIQYQGGTTDFVWWKFSFGALKQMVLDAGFSRVETLSSFRYGPRGHSENMNHVVFKAYR